jgi:hypothetical protein
MYADRRACACAIKYKNTKALLASLQKMKTDNKQFKIRTWKETIASQCRWSEYAENLIGDWSVLWEDSESDWQGAARVLAFKQGQLRYLEWYYGSCGGCDAYEGMDDNEITKEFETKVMMHFKDIDTFCNWMKLLSETKDTKFEQFYQAISVAFKNQDINWLEDPEKLHAKINVLALLRD